MTFSEYLNQLKHGNINQRAAAIALEYVDVEGAHHKQWVIDQMLRLIAGEAYTTIVQQYEAETGQTWDTGIAP